MKDFAPITLVASTPLLLLAHPSVPAANLREFIDHAKQAPKGFSYATAGGATASHLAGELLGQLTGIPLVPVHYKGGGAAMTAIMAGETKAGFNPPLLAMPHVKAGKVKAYVTTGKKRFAGASELPTVAEAGLAALESEYWVAMFAPAGTPETLISKFNRDVGAVLRTPAMQEMLLAQGAEAVPGTPDELTRFMKSEIARWRKVVQVAGIRVD
jgi:tripartite-type tricarboxylate transporter receptor subunit TctC